MSNMKVNIGKCGDLMKSMDKRMLPSVMWFWLVLLAAVAAEGWILNVQTINNSTEDAEPPSILSGNERQLYFERQWGKLLSKAEQQENELSSLLETASKHHGLGGKQYKVVCYFTSWSSYRKGVGRFVPEDIDTNLCTHVIYAFADLDADNYEIKVSDPQLDMQHKFYKRIAALAQKGVKTSIGLGGWKDSAGNKYSRLVNNPQARAHFVQQVTRFIEQYGFTGLDVDWEYPKCWHSVCSQGPASDKEGFSALMAELSAAFRPRNLHLSAAVSFDPAIIDVAYNIPLLNEHLDWVSLMGYDYHGSWERKTGHLAPLYHHNGDTNPNFNVVSSIEYWLGQGLEKEKLVVGMPMYGHSFTLANPSNNGLNAPATGPGRPGPITRAAGSLAFYEICAAVKRDGWTVRRVSDGSMGPYAFKGDQWVGYDDISDIKKKSKLVKSKGLGGGMIWAPDLDDFRNACGCGRYPLLTALSSTLNGGPAPPVENCTS